MELPTEFSVKGLPWPCESGDHEHCSEINRHPDVKGLEACPCPCHSKDKPLN